MSHINNSQYTYTLSEIELILPELWNSISGYSIIAFSGDMGAGKTTLIHQLCHMLGVTDAVSSPTFALINEYHFTSDLRDKVIYHMDWYRIKNEEELVTSGIEDCMLQAAKQQDYCFIEWPEKATGLLPHPYALVKIEVLDERLRQLSLTITP